MRLVALSVSLASWLHVANATAADLTPRQKDGVCRVSLARINGNQPGDYSRVSSTGDITSYKSAKGYEYDCEVFGDGNVITLSSQAWGRLKPTGNLTVEGKCIAIKLYDPGFAIQHALKSCQ